MPLFAKCFFVKFGYFVATRILLQDFGFSFTKSDFKAATDKWHLPIFNLIGEYISE